MDQLTDHQIRLLKVIDHLRWGEDDQLDGFKFHLCRRAIGQRDPIIEFEYKLAVEHLNELGGPDRAISHPEEFISPPFGTAARSPWMDSYGIDLSRYEAAGSVDSLMAGVS